jgi:hypothetical protein
VTDTPLGEAGRLPIVLIVSPASGRLRILPPDTFRGGREWLEKGQPIAEVVHGPGREPEQVLAPYRGFMGGLMGRDGEPIRQGQPVAWMESVPGTDG